jgi:hypothetical protein
MVSSKWAYLLIVVSKHIMYISLFPVSNISHLIHHRALFSGRWPPDVR